MIFLRCALAVELLAIVAWVIAWRRARPDLCSMWLAVKLCALLLAIAAAAVASAFGPALYLSAVICADVVGAAVAIRLWLRRRQMLGPVEASSEARRLADAALDMAETAEREARDHAP